jgi:hypothetical protein
MRVARRNELVSLLVRLRVAKELFKGAAVGEVGDGYPVDGERPVTWAGHLAIVSESCEVPCIFDSFLKGGFDDTQRPGEESRDLGAKPFVELFSGASQLHADEIGLVTGREVRLLSA